MGISAVINTLNEEANIADCIRSVQGFADEIVVCDMYSDDKTVEIATAFDARIVMYERIGYWGGEPRRYAIQHTSYDWILMIDADERLTPELAERLRQISTSNEYDCVKFAKLTLYFGGFPKHGRFFTPNQPLFFRKQVYLDNYSGIENQPHQDWAGLHNIKNSLVLSTQFHYIHLAYPTIEKYICKTIGMYARLEAENYFHQGQKFSLARLLLNPLKVFVTSFFLQQGFRDGLRGFILNVLYAGYWFATWANLWLLEVLEKQKITGTKFYE